MSALINKIKPSSIAEELEIQAGDILLSINGNKFKDVIDYKFLITDEYLELEIERNNEIWIYEVEKDYDEDLGIEFENSIIDGAKRCSNNCMFCFIDQLPKGMRETLYFKDDDSRLSFLQGNFVTLTNMKDEDIDRIIRYRISPINISVHTTNPELRQKMLNNRFAGKVYERMKKLSDASITMNAQIVSCPGINNGDELINTIEDLYKLHPSLQNVAVVPVGTTKYREGLPSLSLYTEQSAKEEIERVRVLQEKYIKEIGEPFVRLSDEFYVTANEEIEKTQFYGNLEQIEDGIGVIRSLRDNIDLTINNLKDNISGRFIIPTGKSAYQEVERVANIIKNKNKDVNVEVYEITNDFFGENITVSGLLTGTDLYKNISKIEGDFKVLIASNMLRYGENVFLDDITVEKLSQKLNKKIIPVDYTGEDLIEIINNNC